MKQLLLCLAALTLLAAPCAAQNATGPFADVPLNHWAYQDVDTLQKAGIVMGDPDYPTGSGRREITRKYFAAAIARLLSQMSGPPSQSRKDIETRLLASRPAILALQDLVRQFRAELTLLNANVDTIQARLTELERSTPRPLAAKPFRDVPPTHWAASAVETLRRQGLVAGYPQGTFTISE